MAIKLPSHLHRSRSGILHFRVAIPPDIRHHFATKEIYRSLRTASVREAAIHAVALSTAFKQVFDRIRQQNMSDQKKRPQTAHSLLRAGLTLEIKWDEHNQPKVSGQSHPNDPPGALRAAIDAALAAPNTPAVQTVPHTSPTLSVAIEDFVRAKQVQGRWTEKTGAENRAVYDLLMRIVGDRPIAEIDDESIVNYLDTLKKLPANLNKDPAYIGKTIAEVIALEPPPMAVRTINKNLERVSSLFKWVKEKRKYGVTHNPAAGMSLDESNVDKRQPFTSQELVALFSSEEFITRKFQNPYAYWLMSLGLLTGARLGELCQLYVSDFVEYGGVPCIDISDSEEGQRVKTRNAKRLVPIHDRLIELGILRYVAALRDRGENRLFPELSLRRDGFAQAASNWFQRHKKKCGLKGKHTKVFHSFRHTFISALLDDEVPEHVVAQIVGHEANLITGQVYWNARDAAKRKPTIDEFKLPEEVWQLIPKFEQINIVTRRNAKQGK